jgi:hypothetical protein
MKRKFSELCIDSEDEDILKHKHKRCKIDATSLVNKIFQDEFDVSFDLKSILDEYLNFELENEEFCIYCQKFYLERDCIECDCCEKIICEKCEHKYWNKALDFRDNSVFSCCLTCSKGMRYCNICRTYYIPPRNRCDNICCKICKKYHCNLCMPFRFAKVHINEHNVHVGGGKYKLYNKVKCSQSRFYCRPCFFQNISKYPNNCFIVIKD